jgi:hypothetical protein
MEVDIHVSLKAWGEGTQWKKHLNGLLAEEEKLVKGQETEITWRHLGEGKSEKIVKE